MSSNMNANKYDSYKQGMVILNQAYLNKNLPLSIAAIAIAESIIADRCFSYLNFKEKEFISSKENNIQKIGTNTLVEKCQKHFKSHSIAINKRSGEIFQTTDLFADVKLWLQKRNKILHTFAKSRPGFPTLTFEEYCDLAIETAQCGFKYSSLIIKWHKSELRKSNKV
jgi:hypothetical protein